MLEHELRRRIVSEMHLRKWPTLVAPCMIIQWVRNVGDVERAIENELLVDRLALEAIEDANIPLTHATGAISDVIRFAWEKHSEGSSLTLFIDVEAFTAFVSPSDVPEITEAISWGEQFPGRVLRATRIWVAQSEADVSKDIGGVGFSSDDMVSCYIKGGVRLWSDFRIQEDGYGRLVVAANDLNRSDLTRCVQQLQELGNYRNRALLGLPVARLHWLELNSIEERLNSLGECISDPDTTDDNLLNEISGLSLDLVAIVTAVNFRMSATIAYGKLVEERLHGLNCQPIEGLASLRDFTERRFWPAIRTCAAFKERTIQLSEQASQMTSLLRTRIETRIENQNSRLLESVEWNAARQFRLQEVVEGLSIVAVSYYAVSLFFLFVKGLYLSPKLESRISTISIPIFILCIWMIIRKLKKKIIVCDSE